MRSIDKVMNMATCLFLEILTGVQLLTTKVNLYTTMKLVFGRNIFGRRIM